jgi:aminoglycoside 6'-N-acetyltransferase
VTAADLTGDRVQLRPVQPDDVDVLREIRASPSVRRWWGPPEEPGWPFGDDDVQVRSVWHEGNVVGLVQWYENADHRYRHAGIDLFLAEPAQGQGLGRETVTLVVRHLVDTLGHHRIVIDPAADNERAIACYAACGFRAVGTMRRYEKDVDGDTWHDGLLMELVVDP